MTHRGSAIARVVRLSVLCTFAAVATPIVLYIGYQVWIHQTGSFDSFAWKRADPYEDLIRYQMAKHLIGERALIGLTRDQVIHKLGPPAAPGFPFEAKNWDMTYMLGPSYTDNYWLLLRLPGGKVTENQLYED